LVSAAVERLERFERASVRFGAWHRFSLEIAFRRQKVTAKLLKRWFLRYVLFLINQEVTLATPDGAQPTKFKPRV
jgi:hypothetical protein